MLKNFFRHVKTTSIAPTVAPPTGVTATMTERRKVPRPLPTVEAIESDFGDTDWDLWIETEKGPLGPV